MQLPVAEGTRTPIYLKTLDMGFRIVVLSREPLCALPIGLKMLSLHLRPASPKCSQGLVPRKVLSFRELESQRVILWANLRLPPPEHLPLDRSAPNG